MILPPPPPPLCHILCSCISPMTHQKVSRCSRILWPQLLPSLLQKRPNRLKRVPQYSGAKSSARSGTQGQLIQMHNAPSGVLEPRNFFSLSLAMDLWPYLGTMDGTVESGVVGLAEHQPPILHAFLECIYCFDILRNLLMVVTGHPLIITAICMYLDLPHGLTLNLFQCGHTEHRT